MTQALKTALYRRRGDNRALAEEIAKLTPESQRRLLEVLRELEEETHREKNKHIMGRWW